MFGYASAAVQVEGASNVDGKSLSIWDTFAATAGKISDGSRPDVANNEYNLVNETIALLKMTG
jgi:beta-glucosidase/6-phospho-beta-glucosidase/beta-galactosidase